MRFKNRWLVTEIYLPPGSPKGSDAALTTSALRHAVLDAVQANFGQHGMGMLAPTVQGG